MTEHAYVYDESAYTHDDECPACVEQTCSAGHYIGAFEDCGICKCGADYGAHQSAFGVKTACGDYRNHDTGKAR